MPTAKKRVNITVDDSLYGALERLSRIRKKSISGLSLSLIEKAIELEEDFYFSREADERLSKGEKRLSHKKSMVLSVCN